MHALPIWIFPAKESSFARGWITLSELIVMLFEPLRMADSAIVIDEEN
jgi:hypothetical protein